MSTITYTFLGYLFFSPHHWTFLKANINSLYANMPFCRSDRHTQNNVVTNRRRVKVKAEITTTAVILKKMKLYCTSAQKLDLKTGTTEFRYACFFKKLFTFAAFIWLNSILFTFFCF